MADALRFLDRPMAEQVIEGQYLLLTMSFSCFPIREPQSAEQLVEVPTVLSPLRIAEQIVGTPVPLGRGKRRVPGFLPEQTSTAAPSVERISERIVEQFVDISPGGGLAQGSASSARAAAEDFTGVFRTFRHGKSAECREQVVSAELVWHVSSSTLSAHQMARVG